MVVPVADQLSGAAVGETGTSQIAPLLSAFALLLQLTLALEGQPLKRVAPSPGGLHAFPAWLIEKWLASEKRPPHRHSGCKLSQYVPSWT